MRWRGLGLWRWWWRVEFIKRLSMERALLHFFTLVQMFMSLGSWQNPLQLWRRGERIAFEQPAISENTHTQACMHARRRHIQSHTPSLSLSLSLCSGSCLSCFNDSRCSKPFCPQIYFILFYSLLIVSIIMFYLIYLFMCNTFYFFISINEQ